MDEGINLHPQAEYDLLLGASQSKKRRRETATSSTSGDGSPSSATSQEDFFSSQFRINVDVNVSQSLSTRPVRTR